MVQGFGLELPGFGIRDSGIRDSGFGSGMLGGSTCVRARCLALLEMATPFALKEKRALY